MSHLEMSGLQAFETVLEKLVEVGGRDRAQQDIISVMRSEIAEKDREIAHLNGKIANLLGAQRKVTEMHEKASNLWVAAQKLCEDPQSDSLLAELRKQVSENRENLDPIPF